MDSWLSRLVFFLRLLGILFEGSVPLVSRPIVFIFPSRSCETPWGFARESLAILAFKLCGGRLTLLGFLGIPLYNSSRFFDVVSNSTLYYSVSAIWNSNLFSSFFEGYIMFFGGFSKESLSILSRFSQLFEAIRVLFVSSSTFPIWISRDSQRFCWDSSNLLQNFRFISKKLMTILQNSLETPQRLHWVMGVNGYMAH